MKRRISLLKKIGSYDSLGEAWHLESDLVRNSANQLRIYVHLGITEALWSVFSYLMGHIEYYL